MVLDYPICCKEKCLFWIAKIRIMLNVLLCVSWVLNGRVSDMGYVNVTHPNIYIAIESVSNNTIPSAETRHYIKYCNLGLWTSVCFCQSFPMKTLRQTTWCSARIWRRMTWPCWPQYPWSHSHYQRRTHRGSGENRQKSSQCQVQACDKLRNTFLWTN